MFRRVRKNILEKLNTKINNYEKIQSLCTNRTNRIKRMGKSGSYNKKILTNKTK